MQDQYKEIKIQVRRLLQIDGYHSLDNVAKNVVEECIKYDIINPLEVSKCNEVARVFKKYNSKIKLASSLEDNIVDNETKLKQAREALYFVEKIDKGLDKYDPMTRWFGAKSLLETYICGENINTLENVIKKEVQNFSDSKVKNVAHRYMVGAISNLTSLDKRCLRYAIDSGILNDVDINNDDKHRKKKDYKKRSIRRALKEYLIMGIDEMDTTRAKSLIKMVRKGLVLDLRKEMRNVLEYAIDYVKENCEDIVTGFKVDSEESLEFGKISYLKDRGFGILCSVAGVSIYHPEFNTVDPNPYDAEKVAEEKSESLKKSRAQCLLNIISNKGFDNLTGKELSNIANLTVEKYLTSSDVTKARDKYARKKLLMSLPKSSTGC